MTSSAPTAGALQIAAALVFHLPGARLELTGANGHRCSIGPMTDPRCTLHPAEFRELVLAAGNCELLGTLLGFALVDEPTMTLTSSGVDMNHLGAGLYRVVGCEFTSYAFTTPLPADQVDNLLSSLDSGLDGCSADASGDCDDGRGHPSYAAHQRRCSADPSGDCDDGVTMCVSLVRDDGLGVTLVVMSPFDVARIAFVEAAARAAASACLVAEMEQLTIQSDGFAV